VYWQWAPISVGSFSSIFTKLESSGESEREAEEVAILFASSYIAKLYASGKILSPTDGLCRQKMQSSVWKATARLLTDLLWTVREAQPWPGLR
jgi:hypothetical protein